MENAIIKTLIKKGVKIPNPESVYISDDVNPDRISGENVTIHTGCKIIGERSLVMRNSQLGHEAPVTLENTLVGENTKLKGGFFTNAVFAGDNSFGSGAHVRNGTILEEQSNAAHTVGLKQTILFPFVTLGSLINFCDCLMAGGTSRKDHSEVGSSFIHFNYTPNQDKATPSMMGNVHQGVMLNSKPIFLGGQGGLVGPVRIGYGCITAAGSIIRKNELKQGRLVLGGAFKEVSVPRQYDVYTNISHIFNNNIHYIAGLISLKSWYKHIRPLFVYDDFSRALINGMQKNLDMCIKERIHRFKIFCEKLNLSKEILLSKTNDKSSKAILIHDKAMDKFKLASQIFNAEVGNKKINKNGEAFIFAVEKKIEQTGKKYIKTIQSLSPDESKKGIQWLFDVEQNMVEQLLI
ncbi:UDP-N-acetylglucosamine pyrophosphorylase [Desulfobacula toluolica]|uniref:Predicted UDP-N-acetylglucosamine pyrophosphorylase n=1 Tax=Desulfobacula toluolica (strain DSM 7467 / Tol2) TaxID=651182 RepID=K0NH75_DESTT|nr:UDP-N-acetylglucosamine pyrophosphorylase [Desulfobacula toluolica]CCK80325.1 predicted UDP-N-acetylglucosamine pyrophosphorylase [Desulfobacula toluolica Tol2]